MIDIEHAIGPLSVCYHYFRASVLSLLNYYNHPRLIVIGAILFCITATVSGQAEALVTNLTGTQLLKQADDMLNNRISQLGQTGNGLINQLTTNLSVLTESARLNLKDVLDRPLKDMESSQRTVFLAINDLDMQIQKGVGAAYKLEEVTNIDIADRCGSQIPFCKSIEFISSISGLAVLHWTPTHTITITATGLGPGDSKRTVQVKFFLGGKQIYPRNTDLSTHDQGRYIFDTHQFTPFFSKSRPRTLDVVAQLVARNRGWFTSDQYVNSHLMLTLYPETAGTATLSYKVPVFGWITKERRSEPFPARDCGAKQCGDGGVHEGADTKAVSYTRAGPPLPQSQQVANPVLRCGPPWWDGAGCVYNYGRSVSLANPPDHVHAEWQQTGVWVTMYVDYDVLEWGKTIVDPKAQEFKLQYDQNFDFCLPDTVSYYIINGHAITGEPFSLVTEQSVPDFLSFNGKFSCEGNGYRYSYKVLRPR
jgi:hypothetical protein